MIDCDASVTRAASCIRCDAGQVLSLSDLETEPACELPRFGCTLRRDSDRDVLPLSKGSQTGGDDLNRASPANDSLDWGGDICNTPILAQFCSVSWSSIRFCIQNPNTGSVIRGGWIRRAGTVYVAADHSRTTRKGSAPKPGPAHQGCQYPWNASGRYLGVR